jgi:MYXO-CTERM domain-containing protein
MPEDQQRTYQHVEPLDVDAVRTVQIGTVLWAVALIVTLIMRDDLQDDGRTWWIWTCVAGVALGLLGLLVTVRRRRRLARNGAAAQRS